MKENCATTQTLRSLPVELDAIAEAYLEEWRRNRSVSPEQYAEQYPHFAEEIRELFPALTILEGTVCSEEAVPDSIGDYRVVELLGRGGMGVVYRAIQPNLGREVAVKVLPSAKFGSTEAKLRFEREARAVAKLKHPHIVPVYEVGSLPDALYYSMQVVDGFSLRQLITHHRLRSSNTSSATDKNTAADTVAAVQLKRDDPNTSAIAGITKDLRDRERHANALIETTFSNDHWNFAARLGRDLALALQHAHESHVIHRDIKPSNIMLDESGKAWLTDFGLAKLEDDDEKTATGIVLGTLRYMSPEQFQGSAMSASDQYSLGATLFEIITLRPVHEGKSASEIHRQVFGRPPSFPIEVASKIPCDLRTIVQRCLRFRADERYESMAQLADDFDRFLKGRPILARRASWWEKLRWFALERRVAILALLAALALIVAGLFARLAMPEPDILPGGNDRVMAEWALSHNGYLVLITPEGSLTVDALEDVPDDLFNIDGLHLHGYQKLTREKLGEILDLPNVSAIGLTDTNFDESWIEDIRRKPDLVSLNLSGCKITDKSAPIIGKFKKLRYLGLNSNQLTDQGVAELTTLAALSELTIADNVELTNRCIDSIRQFQFLELLDIRYTKVTKDGIMPLWNDMQNRPNNATLYFGDDSDGTMETWRHEAK